MRTSKLLLLWFILYIYIYIIQTFFQMKDVELTLCDVSICCTMCHLLEKWRSVLPSCAVHDTLDQYKPKLNLHKIFWYRNLKYQISLLYVIFLHFLKRTQHSNSRFYVITSGAYSWGHLPTDMSSKHGSDYKWLWSWR